MGAPLALWSMDDGSVVSATAVGIGVRAPLHAKWQRMGMGGGWFSPPMRAVEKVGGRAGGGVLPPAMATDHKIHLLWLLTTDYWPLNGGCPTMSMFALSPPQHTAWAPT